MSAFFIWFVLYNNIEKIVRSRGCGAGLGGLMRKGFLALYRRVEICLTDYLSWILAEIFIRIIISNRNPIKLV